MNPVAQLIRPKNVKQAGQLAFPLAVTHLEGAQVFAMGNVHAALAGDQELATDRRHGIENSHFQADLDRSSATWGAASTSAAIKPAGPPPIMATRRIRLRARLRPV